MGDGWTVTALVKGLTLVSLGGLVLMGVHLFPAEWSKAGSSFSKRSNCFSCMHFCYEFITQVDAAGTIN